MKWSLMELEKHKNQPIMVDETIEMSEELRRRNQEIIQVEPVRAEGTIKVSKGEYLVHLKIETQIVLPSSRSLEPVLLPIHCEVDELYMTPQRFESQRQDLEEERVVILLEEDKLDLVPAIEDYLLLAIPIQVLTDEERKTEKMPKGSFWEVVSEEEYAKRKKLETQTTIDPRLAKLSELKLDNEDSDKK